MTETTTSTLQEKLDAAIPRHLRAAVRVHTLLQELSQAEQNLAAAQLERLRIEDLARASGQTFQIYLEEDNEVPQGAWDKAVQRGEVPAGARLLYFSDERKKHHGSERDRGWWTLTVTAHYMIGS